MMHTASVHEKHNKRKKKKKLEQSQELNRILMRGHTYTHKQKNNGRCHKMEKRVKQMYSNCKK